MDAAVTIDMSRRCVCFDVCYTVYDVMKEKMTDNMRCVNTQFAYCKFVSWSILNRKKVMTIIRILNFEVFMDVVLTPEILRPQLLYSYFAPIGLY